ncbi:glycosyltransferase family 1 protein [Halorubrum sp. SS5]|nr:glycosyltransferase family 1 protein [Halorubrum sp. SS5]
MTEITVLHIITRFRNGGAETTTSNELDALHAADEKYDLHLGYGYDSDENAVTTAVPDFVTTVRFDQIRHGSLARTLPAVFEVARYLRQTDCDVVHTHSTEAGIIGRWAGTLARTPTIIHEVHGDPITDDRSAVLNAFVTAMERLSAPIATKLIVKSERIREDFLERGIGTQEQYKLIYHGVDVERFSGVAPADVPESNANRRLLFVGRLSDGKGLVDLLNGFEVVAERHSVDLLIAGDGPIRSALEEIIEQRGLSDSVFCLGYRTDIPQLLAASDVLVLPSYREGTPRVISEALASGTPVVATQIAGIPEQVTDDETGLLIEPGDIDGLVNAIDTLLADGQRRNAMSSRCRNTVNQFSRASSTRAIQELYRSIAY